MHQKVKKMHLANLLSVHNWIISKCGVKLRDQPALSSEETSDNLSESEQGSQRTPRSNNAL